MNSKQILYWELETAEPKLYCTHSDRYRIVLVIDAAIITIFLDANLRKSLLKKIAIWRIFPFVKEDFQSFEDCDIPQ